MTLLSSKPTEEIEVEYRTIESTLLETARGRWFLSEHGRRARRLDSALLEDAIGRLQDSLRQPPALLGQLETEMDGLKTHIATSKQALLSRRAEAGEQGDAEPMRPQEILKTAESIHDLAWSLQANPFDPKGCEQIARHAAQMYTLSQMHAAESQRSIELADALEVAVTRIDGIMQTVSHERVIDKEPPAARPAQREKKAG